MGDPRDHVDIDGLRDPDDRDDASTNRRPSGSDRKFLMIWFRCCHVYGRLTRDPDGARYAGRCPRCAATVSVRIGPGGTDRRVFEAG